MTKSSPNLLFADAVQEMETSFRNFAVEFSLSTAQHVVICNRFCAIYVGHVTPYGRVSGEGMWRNPRWRKMKSKTVKVDSKEILKKIIRFYLKSLCGLLWYMNALQLFWNKIKRKKDGKKLSQSRTTLVYSTALFSIICTELIKVILKITIWKKLLRVLHHQNEAKNLNLLEIFSKHFWCSTYALVWLQTCTRSRVFRKNCACFKCLLVSL